MSNEFTPNQDQDQDLGLSELLAGLDPGHGDQTYWPRFHRSVMAQTLAELGRRRVIANLTVSQIMHSWARTVLPTAAAAAAVAAIVLLRPVPSPLQVPAGMIAVEEALMEGLDGQPIPDVLSDEGVPGGSGATFASEIF